jgi:hypothetical protein
MVGSADAGTGIGGTADKVKILSSCAIACNSITSAKIVNGTIVNDDINASAGISLSKLASCPLARANHTGTQAASTISDFDTEVANNTAVAANTAKTGITGGQASAITTNTAKISYCSTASTKLGTIEGSATADQTAGEIKTAYESNACTNALTDVLSAEITANTAKISYSCAASTAVAANTAKISYSCAASTAVAANTAKISYCGTASTKLATIESCATADQTGAQIKTAYEGESCTNALTDTLLANIGTNNSKTGITGGQATAITANTAKISYCSTASSKLATIAACANNYSHTTNANLTGEVTSSGNSTTIASDMVDEDNLKISNAGTNGHFLSKQSGDTGGLTWAAVSAGYSAPTIGSTSIASGATVTTIAGLTLTTPALGTPTSLVGTNISGTASCLTAGTVTTNANLTGDVTSSGNATTIATDAVDIGMLSATGTADATTFLRGDNAWAVVDASPLTTKGDVYTFDTGNQRLAVGSNGEVLKACSSTATGLVWGTGGGGATALHSFTANTQTTVFTVSGQSIAYDVGTTVATQAAGVGTRDVYIRKIDANNEGVFTIIHKNGALVEVQIA